MIIVLIALGAFVASVYTAIVSYERKEDGKAYENRSTFTE